MKRVLPPVLLALVTAATAQQQPPAKPPTKPSREQLQPGRSRAQGEHEGNRLGQIIDGKLVLRNLDGKVVRLADLLGEVTVINFFSVASDSQLASNARFAALQREFDGVRFLHIDSCEHEIGLRPPKVDGANAVKPYARIRKFLAKNELPFEALADHHHLVATALDAKTTPHLFVLDGKGKLVYRGSDDKAKHGKVPRLLRQLLAGASVEPCETKPHGTPIPLVQKAKAGHTLVVDNIDLAIATARREGKLVLYNFSGFNCAGSRIAEHDTFMKENVRKLLREHFVEARIHADMQGTLTADQFNKNRKLQIKMTGHQAMPTFVAADPFKDVVFETIILSGSWQDWPRSLAASLTKSATDAGRKLK